MSDWSESTLKSSLDLDTNTLCEHEVHVWSIDLQSVGAELLGATALLSSDELQRASKFKFSKDSQRFSSTRCALRSLLGRYLECAPNRVRFHYSPAGKPSLGGMHSRSTIRFNISHSDDMAILAFARNREIGIDIERVREAIEVFEIAERFFSEAERRDLFSLSATDRRLAFFNCWTRKEAYIKADGQGMALSLKSFDVSIKSSERPEIRASRPDPTQALRWTVLLPPVPSGYSAALVIEGKDCALKSYQLSNGFELIGSGH